MAGSKGQDDESDEDDWGSIYARLRTTTKGKDGPSNQRPWSSVTSTKKTRFSTPFVSATASAAPQPQAKQHEEPNLQKKNPQRKLKMEQPKKYTGHHGEEKSDRQISVILSDTDVLDCPICFEPLRPPVFQCKNGHIACASCCTKMANKCSNCSLQIGFVRCRAIEKVVESVTISCPKAYYGCKETILYSKKLDHENACIYVPCSCPHPTCDYVGSPTVLYTHFVGNHSDYSMLFDFDSPIPISLDKSHNQIFLLERNECIVFVLYHSTNHLGSLVNVVLMERASEKRRSSYCFISRDGESTIVDH
ncbi:E3 ubiquitin-protein ligase SINA-like 10 [Abeliophyllum distichum]|uniref:RING-type E3 ubiquitin transferase n=1 Tax=Abeliophyllum distichum TaxID=126358 RepID=A0ABD1SIG2_9LAMI